jgi:hypothetical protein
VEGKSKGESGREGGEEKAEELRVKRGEGEISWREEGEGVFRGFSKNS